MRTLLDRFNAKPTIASAARLLAYLDKHPFAVITLRDSDKLSIEAAKAIL